MSPAVQFAPLALAVGTVAGVGVGLYRRDLVYLALGLVLCGAILLTGWRLLASQVEPFDMEGEGFDLDLVDDIDFNFPSTPCSDASSAAHSAALLTNASRADAPQASPPALLAASSPSGFPRPAAEAGRHWEVPAGSTTGALALARRDTCQSPERPGGVR